MSSTTSDERREVAEELRNYMRLRSSDTFEAFYTRLNGVLFGDDGFDRPDSDVFERLADLIDPICHLGPAHFGGFGCDRCFTWFPDMKKRTSHCPECGARVVDEDD